MRRARRTEALLSVAAWLVVGCDGKKRAPSADEAEVAPDGNSVDYVTQALSERSRGVPVSAPETKAHGCSVKYASS